jgi:polyphosphate glucokinase
MTMASSTREVHPQSHPSGPRTLAIDIGGTALKASVLDSAGEMTADRVRIPTPYPCPPEVLLQALATLTAPLPEFDRVSIGFPGVVRRGLVLTAPHFGTDKWANFALAKAAADLFHHPARLLNDAEVQGLGIMQGHGIEVVLTLGTGVGSAIFSEGRLAPHLELAQHPLHEDKTYNEYVGNQALQEHGTKKWGERVLKMIAVVETLLHYDTLYLGGGNSKHLSSVKLPENVQTASNDMGIIGGIRLWDDRVWRDIPEADVEAGPGNASRKSREAARRQSPLSSSTKPIAGAS